MQMADAYSTREIVPLLGITRQAIDKRAKREAWKAAQRSGRGGGNLWDVASMPPATRDAIASALLREARAATCPSTGDIAPATRPAEVKPEHSPEWQRASAREREVAAARLVFVREIERLSAIVKKEGAIRHLVEASRTRSLSPVLLDLINTATACRRGGVLSRRSLYRWASDYAVGGEAALLPSMSRKQPLPEWMQEFLCHYQKPQHPPVSQAYDDFAEVLRRRGETPPSVYAVRRALAKMSTPAREAGRATGNALLKLRPHRRRNTSELWPGDVYTADGTTFDAEVLHPLHGQPFKPEITAILDVATRRCVGISIALAESKLTVLDALRMGCIFAGIPAMFYSDNGPGYANNLMLDDRTGMLQRLGITPCHAIPGRPQGKGLMERAVKTLWVRAAQGLESYTGALMDPDAAHANYKRSRKALKAGKRAVLPTWEEAKRHILARVEEYNATPHRGLPRYRDAEGRYVHYSPNEYWAAFEVRGFKPVRVPEGMGAELFMPGERRVARNGWVEVFGGRYYGAELADYHGEAVEVRYDIWDSSRVWCWTLDGRRICEALLEGNTQPYFAPSRMEAARDKRARAQVARLDARLQRVAPGAEILLPEAEHPALADSLQAEAQAATLEILPAEVPAEEPAPTARPLFGCTYDRYCWLMEHADQQTPADAAWLVTYRQGEEYADMRELLEIKGIA